MISPKKLLFPLLATSVFVAFGVYYYFQIYLPSVNEKAGEETTPNWESYSNRDYGYSIDYPKNLSLEESASLTVYLRRGEDPIFEITPLEKYIGADEDMDFRLYAVTLAGISCAADGLLSSIRCEGEVETSSFTNNYGVGGIFFYLNEVTSTYEDGQTVETTRKKGPYFAFDVYEKTKGQLRALFLLPSSGELSAADLQAVEQIKESLRF